MNSFMHNSIKFNLWVRIGTKIKTLSLWVSSTHIIGTSFSLLLTSPTLKNLWQLKSYRIPPTALCNSFCISTLWNPSSTMSWIELPETKTNPKLSFTEHSRQLWALSCTVLPRTDLILQFQILWRYSEELSCVLMKLLITRLVQKFTYRAILVQVCNFKLPSISHSNRSKKIRSPSSSK